MGAMATTIRSMASAVWRQGQFVHLLYSDVSQNPNFMKNFKLVPGTRTDTGYYANGC